MSGNEAAVECVLEADNDLGETPVWSSREQALYWVNCEGPPELHRWSPTTGGHKVWAAPKRVGGLVLKAGGGVLVVLSDGLYDFDPADGRLTVRVASPTTADIKLHECACDRQGRFWVGGYDHRFSAENPNPRGAGFFRLDRETLTLVIKGINVSNGLAFSPDGRVMYICDSPHGLVEAFDLDPATGELSGRRPFFALSASEGYVDGATVYAEGGYWVAVVGGAQLRRYTPDGKLDRTVPLPFSNPTKPAFGGPDLDVIYVTSTKMQINLPGVAGAERNGGLYAVRAGVQGLPEPEFVA